MEKPLLIEIGVEELPAEPLLKELKNIEPKWKKILDEFNFSTQFSFFYTPRRLVLWHRQFPERQPNQFRELFGPPLNIAYRDGEPTKACESFAKKCNTDISQLQTIKRGDREFLYYSYEKEGQPIDTLLEEMITKWLKSLNFGKSMRWGDGKYSFIRPIHSIVALYGDRNIPITIFGVESRPQTFGHRSAENSAIYLTHTGDYFCNLPKHGVMVNQKERELTILHQFEKLEKQHNIKIEIDKNLLNEVVAITEEPTSLLGNFDKKFLELPDEVIITSMKEHQRYFPVYKDGKLANMFVVVSNALTSDFSEVIKGNERVLRARLSDALFFYHNDLKRGLVSDGLEKIVFVEGLGTMADKVERESRIGEVLSQLYNCNNSEALHRAIQLSKCDLLTEMVYEFTELQGVMGAYYGEKLGESSEVVTAIREQYLPNSEGGELPSNRLSSIVAMSYKLDLLFGLFSIGHVPTGSRDPFGLRRAVNGVVRIALNQGFKFDLEEIYNLIGKYYKPFDFSKLRDFFFERVKHFYRNINPSIVQSVLLVESEIGEIDRKIEAVHSLIQSENFGERLATFKRVANILKDSDISKLSKVDSSLLVEEAEKRLYEKFVTIRDSKFQNYRERLEQLFSLKPDLDNFFNSVMVNVEDSKLRENRKSLMGEIYREFLKISDIKEITKW